MRPPVPGGRDHRDIIGAWATEPSDPRADFGVAVAQAVHGCGRGRNDDRADQNSLDVVRDAGEVAAVGEDGHQEGTDDGAQDAAAPARHHLRSVRDAQVGAVTFVQRADSALRLDPHFRTSCLDGVYVRDEHGVLARELE